MGMSTADDEYLKIILNAIQVSASYMPKFGLRAKKGGLTLEEFCELYQNDVFYNWFGLDDPAVYAAHRVSGGITSIYRQIGTGCEALFRRILKDSLELSEEDVKWPYKIPLANNKASTLRLNGRIPIEKICDTARQDRVRKWMRNASRKLKVTPNISNALTGIAFEVRQGYKSKDSHRQHADIDNTAQAYTRGYLPCMVIMSDQISGHLLERCHDKRWLVLTGVTGTEDPLASTYDFMRDVVGYDLAAFFKRNSEEICSVMNGVLKTLLDE